MVVFSYNRVSDKVNFISKAGISRIWLISSRDVWNENRCVLSLWNSLSVGSDRCFISSFSWISRMFCSLIFCCHHLCFFLFFFSELIERFLSFYYTNFSMISCHFSRRVAIFWLICCFEDVICLTTTIWSGIRDFHLTCLVFSSFDPFLPYFLLNF